MVLGINARKLYNDHGGLSNSDGKYNTITEYSTRRPLRTVQFTDEDMLAQRDAILDYAEVSGVQSIKIYLVKTKEMIYEWRKPNIGI